MTAMLTQPTTTASTTTPAPRGCWWEITPYELPDGRLLGYLGVRVGTGRNSKDFYSVVEIQNDDFGRAYEVRKELPNGEYQRDPYVVTLGKHSHPRCTCPGFHFARKCRHADSLKVALSQRGK